jgi:hypothetical protein
MAFFTLLAIAGNITYLCGLKLLMGILTLFSSPFFSQLSP